MPVYYDLEPSRPAGQGLSYEEELEVLCECGHPVRSHSWVTNSNLSDFHIEWIGQCVHPGCNYAEELPREDKRRKKQYQHVTLCTQFRKA